MSNTVSLSAIVLAGGKSSRMGRDKALIHVQGVPMLQRVCAVALKCTREVYVVTPWPDRYQEIVPDSCCFIQELALAGETEPLGPLVGFAVGLARVETDWVLLLACDLPQLRVEVLQDWVTSLENVAENAIAVLSRQPKGWEPLCGFYRRQCLPMLTQFINEGGRSFQHWLAQHPVQELPRIDTQMLLNCNTPADLQRFTS
jgi:molybdopterin-guanine dinucleotide biosynthesis protein A